MEYQSRYYEGDRNTIPIYSRASVSTLKESTHTTVHIDYFSDIIHRKIGYMANGISVKSGDEGLAKVLEEFGSSTKQVTKNIESLTDTSVSGLSHRLIYSDKGAVKIKNIKGWQVVYDFDDDIFDPNEAYYFYTMIDLEGTQVMHCDIYNRETVRYYVKNDKDEFTEIGEEQPHNFNQVPIIPFMNNSDRQGDCLETLPLMDIYDEIISDTCGELKAARLAYLKIFGDLYTGEYEDGTAIPVPHYLKEFGTMLFSTDDQGNQLGDAEFLEKTLDDTAITNMLERLRSHIYEISGSVDLKELTMGSNTRVFTIQAALSRLENSAKTLENFTKMALLKQYQLVFYFIGEYTGYVYDVADLEFEFTRVFIQDKAELASMLQMLMNTMSIEDAYQISELFDDPTAAASRYKAEQGMTLDDDA